MFDGIIISSSIKCYCKVYWDSDVFLQTITPHLGILEHFS